MGERDVAFAILMPVNSSEITDSSTPELTKLMKQLKMGEKFGEQSNNFSSD
ncbi:MAG TPA: hypothetical protein VFS97_08495 [Nitrososphaeraceae archaeon]|nr:hypothetical protein [Nitrososphaeraceae archaeon]